MCAYNQVNGVYSCENDWLLNQVLKGDWRYPGFVMSDWGAVHSTVRSALAGLDQELGEQLDTQNFFDRLGLAVKEGEVPAGAARRHGAADSDLDLRLRPCRRRARRRIPPTFAKARPPRSRSSGEGAVLLRNEGMLPLAADTRRILVVGAHADRGAPSGGGSSQVIPPGGVALKEPEGKNRAMIFDPSSPARGDPPTIPPRPRRLRRRLEPCRGGQRPPPEPTRSSCSPTSI